MESRAEPAGGLAWRLWALVPILLLVAVVALFSARGGSVLELVGQSPPPADDVERKRSTPEPSSSGVMIRSPSRSRRPDSSSTSMIALSTPRVTSSNGASTVVGASPRTTSR